MTSEVEDLSEVNEHYTINKQRLLETVCSEYRVKRLDLVSLLDDGPLELAERNVELIVTYEEGFRLPWMAEYTELAALLEAIYGHEIGLSMSGSARADQLRDRPVDRRTVLYEPCYLRS